MLRKETATFIKCMIKPTLQAVLLVFDKLHDRSLQYHRDNPDLDHQIDRFVDLLIKCYGKAKVEENSQDFCIKLVDFLVKFDYRAKSENCNWKGMLAFKPILCLCSSVGGFCPNKCGEIHADIFSLDGCVFSNVPTDQEKDQQLKDQAAAMQAKVTKQEPVPKKEKSLTTAQEESVMQRARELLVLIEEKVVICLMCEPVKCKDCIAAAQSYMDDPKYNKLLVWLKKHNKYMVTMFVSQLPHAHALVDKKINFTADKFKEFIQSVKDVDGPILPFDDRNVPQLIKLLSSLQAKYLGLIFKEESEYTNNTNIVLKQSVFAGTKLMYFAMKPMRMTTYQEKRMRRQLENMTMENSEKKLKHAVLGMNVYKERAATYQQKWKQAEDQLANNKKVERDLRTGLSIMMNSNQLALESQRERD